MKTAHHIAEAFNLKRKGRAYRGDCPFCLARKQELAVWDKDDGIGCHCYYGACDSRELFRLLVGLESFHSANPTPHHVEASVAAERTEWAKRIWSETVQTKGSLVEKYLRRRGITLDVPADIRLHTFLTHGPTKQSFPALVAAARDADGKLLAIHRTYLSTDSSKAPVDLSKMSLGPIRGCAIQLAAPSEILGLAEGIETALSAMQLSGLPVWCAISAGNMKRLVLPECVREVVIFGDNGGPGERAAQEAAAIFNQEGKMVRVAFPPAGYGDFNDLLKGGDL